MNYRHAFHAGNFADVFKHSILLELLAALTVKDKALCYFDTHAGRGAYRIDSDAARKTGEWRTGIGRLFDEPHVPGPLRRYLGAIRAANPAGVLREYPGSPCLAAQALRAHDQLVLCELQRDECAALRRRFHADHRVHVHARDGYAAVNALLPPAEHRGLVFIDPPFEMERDDLVAIERALGRMHTRWSQGVCAAWYPIKSHRTIVRFHRRVADGPFDRLLVAELLVQPDDSPLRLNGCGMLIGNPPWHLEVRLTQLLAVLRDVLAQSSRATQRLRWLAPE